jgi:hypothetical protein
MLRMLDLEAGDGSLNAPQPAEERVSGSIRTLRTWKLKHIIWKAYDWVWFWYEIRCVFPFHMAWEVDAQPLMGALFWIMERWYEEYGNVKSCH